MLMVRLQRLGTKKTPHHRIVVTERTRAQSSQVLENVGFYDPDAQKLSINQERVRHWVSMGAQTSEAVERLLKRYAKSQQTVKAA